MYDLHKYQILSVSVIRRAESARRKIRINSYFYMIAQLTPFVHASFCGQDSHTLLKEINDCGAAAARRNPL